MNSASTGGSSSGGKAPEKDQLSDDKSATSSVTAEMQALYRAILEMKDSMQAGQPTVSKSLKIRNVRESIGRAHWIHSRLKELEDKITKIKLEDYPEELRLDAMPVISKLKSDYNHLMYTFNKVFQPVYEAARELEAGPKDKDVNRPMGNFELESRIAIEDEEKVSLLRASEDGLGGQLATMTDQFPLPVLAIKRREIDLRDIECGVTRINELMRRISSLVSEQQASVDIIDSNMHDIERNAQNAASELKSAEKSQSLYKVLKMYLVFGIIILFVFILLLRNI